MYIDYLAWKRRSNGSHETSDTEAGTVNSVMQNMPTRKRLRNQSTASISSQPKRSNQGLTSQFALARPRQISAGIQMPTAVKFKKTICIASGDAAECSFLEGEAFEGFLSSIPFGCGSMKLAFNLSMKDGRLYVAKRFFRLSNTEIEDLDDTNPPLQELNAKTLVTPEENRVELESELMRLAYGNWFLKEFFKYCRQQYPDIPVDKDIQFTDAFLGTSTEGDDESTWLIETKRPTTVTKFSGTLAHPSLRSDLQSATIYALAHFVYGKSKKSMVFADIQGSASHVNGKDTMVLFDLMTHTIDGESGIGDFGKDGIASFVKDHLCSDLCRKLSLDTAVGLHAEEVEEDLPSDNEDIGDGFDGAKDTESD